MVKTLTIRDEVYMKLTKVKKSNESFSQLFLELLEKKKATGADLAKFMGTLGENEYLEALRTSSSIRKKLSKDIKQRVI